MSQASLEKVIERYQSDTAFRAELSADLDGTITKAGVDLSAEEVASLRNIIASAGGELPARLSKRRFK